MNKARFLMFTLLLLVLAACGSSPANDVAGLRVVASTSIVGDVVQQIGGDAVQLQVLIPPGIDPHSFEPSPQQVAALTDADLIVIHGLGLEEALASVLQNMQAEGKHIVAVADQVPPLPAAEAGETGFDPHTWTDPNNVLLWVDSIEQALSEADPAHAGAYKSHAEAYRSQLKALDAWIRQQISTIPTDRRLIVTDHLIFTYFAQRYGFRQVGALIPSTSSLAGASAQDLAQLEDNMRKAGVPAIFVGNTVNPELAQRVSQDTGVRLLNIYTGTLSEADGPAATYIDYMRYDVAQLVAGLGP